MGITPCDDNESDGIYLNINQAVPTIFGKLLKEKSGQRKIQATNVCQLHSVRIL